MKKNITRRDFLKNAGISAAGIAFSPVLLSNAFAQEGKRTLRILQWSHFVPRYDKWFDQFARQWGEKNNIAVTVDHIGVSDLRSTFAAEIAAGKGHDIIEFIEPPSDFEPSVLDLTDLNQEAQKKFGKQAPFVKRSTYNPNTKKFYGYSHGWVIDPGDYRKSLWEKVGKPDGPRTWDDLLTYGSKIKKDLGVQMGIGMSQELDSNMAGRALLWSFDASVQDEDENIILDSKKAVEAVKFMAGLYKNAMTPEIFGWNPASNNQLLIAGRASYILNSISAYRSAQKDVPDVAKDIFFSPALKGPRGTGWACEHVIYAAVIPKFAAQNADLAKRFLLDLSENYDRAMWESELYNSPSFFNTTVPSGNRGYPSVKGAKTLRDLHNGWFSNDPYALEGERKDKLVILKDAEKWSTNVGHPGPANPAIGEVSSNFIIPNMFARAAQGKQTPEESVKQAAEECKRIFEKWKAQGLVGRKKK